MLTYNGNIVTVGGYGIEYPAPTPPPPPPPTSVVIGGKTYPVGVMPDGKVWMLVNLDYVYPGLYVLPSGASISSNPQAMYYDYDESTYGWNGYKCGLLYNWYAVDYMETNKSTFFPGWHVPSRAEWNGLFEAIGTDVAGKKLKAVDGSAGTNWPDDWRGTDDYQFAALPGGMFDNGFKRAQEYAWFWTTTEKETEPEFAYYADLSRWADGARVADYSYGYMQYQYSVRLVMDTP